MNTRIGLTLISVLALATVVAATGSWYEDNYVPNPGAEVFANSPVPQNWLSGKYGNNAAQFTVLQTGHNSSHSLGVNVTNHKSGDAKWYVDYTPVDKINNGTFWLAVDWYRSNVTTKRVVSYMTASGTIKTIPLDPVEPSTVCWAKAVDIVFLPAEAVKFTIFHLIDQNGWLQVDDFGFFRNRT